MPDKTQQRPGWWSPLVIGGAGAGALVAMSPMWAVFWLIAWMLGAFVWDLGLTRAVVIAFLVGAGVTEAAFAQQPTWLQRLETHLVGTDADR